MAILAQTFLATQTNQTVWIPMTRPDLKRVLMDDGLRWIPLAPRPHNHRKCGHTAHNGCTPCAAAIAQGWQERWFRTVGTVWSSPCLYRSAGASGRLPPVKTHPDITCFPDLQWDPGCVRLNQFISLPVEYPRQDKPAIRRNTAT